VAKIDLTYLSDQIISLRLIITAMEARIKKLEATQEDTGIYLEGSPDFVKAYYKETKEAESQRLKVEVEK
jgi:hypothetical protein